MMQLLRSNTKVIIWVLVIAFVGTIIFAWGMDITGTRGDGGTPRDVVGSVDGKEIPLNTFYYAADQWIENERRKNPEKDFTESDYRQARQETWNDFVVNLLQQKQIDDKYIRLTDPELVDFIRRYPPQEVQQVEQFQTNGTFDYNKYLSAMGDPNFSQLWAQVEMLMRGRLINYKLQEYIASMVRTSESDLQSRYLRENERIKVDYALVPLSSFDASTIRVDSTQVVDYYNSHLAEFQTPEQAYYTVIKGPKEPSEQDNSKALEEITAVKQELDGGADFSTLASARTMDPSGRDNGGDLGWFARGQMVPAFDSAVFAMKDSTVAGPIKTQFGYHLIYRKGFRTTDGKEEVNAAHILIRATASSETIENLQRLIESFRSEAGGKSDITDLISQYRLTQDRQRKLTRGAGIPGVGRDPEIEKFLFESPSGTLSQIYDRPDAFYIYRAERVAPAGVALLNEVYSLIERDLKLQQQKKMAFGRAERIYNAIMSGSTLADAAEIEGLTVSESGFFSRTGRLPGIGQDPNFIGAAFTLSAANRYSKPVLTQSGAAVIEFKEKLAATLDGFAAQRDTLRSQEVLTLQNAVWDKWFTKIRDAAKIEDYRQEIFGESM